MIKARFDGKQPELTAYTEGDSVRYMICENGKEYSETDTGGNESGGFEYDFAEFVEATSVLSPDTVKKNPGEYLNYVPVGETKKASTEKPATLEQRISDLEETVADALGGEA